jgi:menaquinone-9 beta-reductase
MQTHFDATIIGGGPAGSTAALLFAREGLEVCLIEKRAFPRETLCGEFLSREVIEHLVRTGLIEEFFRLSPNPIHSIRFYNKEGCFVEADLPFQAYGLKRGAFDALLLAAAKNAGVTVLQPSEVKEVARKDGVFNVRVSEGSGATMITSAKLIGAYGKQSILDKALGRAFVNEKSLLNGVKFHVDGRTLPPIEKSAIHLFAGEGFYCGVNIVDEGLVTVCWLERKGSEGQSARNRLMGMLDAAGMSGQKVNSSGIDLEKCHLYGAGNIYFGAKKATANGVFMIGDAAGMIAPLAGDGIGMAIESARLLSAVLRKQRTDGLSHSRTEILYQNEWLRLFERRRRVAAAVQNVLLVRPLRALGFRVVQTIPALLVPIIKGTRSGNLAESWLEER